MGETNPTAVSPAGEIVVQGRIDRAHSRFGGDIAACADRIPPHGRQCREVARFGMIDIVRFFGFVLPNFLLNFRLLNFQIFTLRTF
jgi:hypothetical protein